ncbi:MAG TPA: nuclear transport factor 2 family protein [Candidatus Angelobacter sp.]|nr:nuclear transport factor 2 family protein [Candidatus Angelobacter sp.]
MNSKLMTLRPRLLSFLFVFLLCRPAAFCGEQPPGSASRGTSDAEARQKQAQAELVKLEGNVNDAERNHDIRSLQQTFADDMIYVAYNGVQLSKQKLLDGLGQLKISGYSMKNFSVKPLGPNSMLLTYDLEVKGSILGSDLPPRSRATSIWENRGDHWMLIYHSETPQKHSLLTKLFF